MSKKKNTENEPVEPTGNEEKKTKVSASMIAEQIQSIKNATETIKVAVDQMPECSAKKRFGLSVVNLEKKIADYSKSVGEKLSDDEKELLRKFRAGEITL